MPLDSSIPLQVRPFTMSDPLESYGRFMTISAAQDASALHALQRRKLESDMADEESFKTLYRGATPEQVNSPEFARQMMSISPTRGIATQKALTDIQKDQALTANTRAETVLRDLKATAERAEASLKLLSMATPENWAQVRQQAVSQFGAQSVQSIPEQYPGPAALEKARVSLMDAKDRVTYAMDAANKLMTPDGKGGFTINVPLLQAEMGKAAAGAAKQTTLVNAYTPASETAQTEFMKDAKDSFNKLKEAPVMLANLDKAKALIPGAKGFMGPGGEGMLEAAKFLNNRLGLSINTEGVQKAEELRTRIFQQIMENLKKMDAQPSTYQQKVMEDALGKLGTDPNALPKVLDVAADVVKGKVQVHNKSVQDSIARGVKYPYDPVINLGGAETPTPVQAPEASRRAVGQVYQTPKGPMKWTGNGWVSP